MGLGIPALNTSQKAPASGAPFPAGSANNGLSVDPNTGAIVLGNDTSDNIAQLFSDREIPFPSNEYIRFTQNGSASNYVFITAQHVPGGFPIVGTFADYNNETNLLYARNTNNGFSARTFLGVFNDLGNNLTFGITSSNNDPSKYGPNQPILIAQGPTADTSLLFSALDGFKFLPDTVDPAGMTMRIYANGNVEINPGSVFSDTGEALQVTGGASVKSGNINVLGNGTGTINFINNTTAPGTSAGPAFTNYYGGNVNALGDPVGWLLISVNGVQRKLPYF